MFFGASLLKRISFCLYFSLVWGFAFIWMFNLVMGFDYIFNYFLDSLFASLFMLVVFAACMEALRKIKFNKYKKIKTELQKSNTILFDKTVLLEFNAKAFDGWIFLTNENIIFKSLKKNNLYDLRIPLNSINNITKFKLGAIILDCNGIFYKFVLFDRNTLYDLLFSINPNQQQ